ncbi:hypothetical protein FA15DRAFT_657115 [Coprinopsis marcescibilis]|uniref:Uncharacterized protein n=1 Tax=Coprinopsis marcescibilis TaxID=230819 RepID=A0A5C3L3Z7_COPMA|nr:hypothetical protein FA15DRAFT_657115 [Coprinopsis marcescibilis]
MSPWSAVANAQSNTGLRRHKGQLATWSFCVHDWVLFRGDLRKGPRTGCIQSSNTRTLEFGKLAGEEKELEFAAVFTLATPSLRVWASGLRVGCYSKFRRREHLEKLEVPVDLLVAGVFTEGIVIVVIRINSPEGGVPSFDHWALGPGSCKIELEEDLIALRYGDEVVICSVSAAAWLPTCVFLMSWGASSTEGRDLSARISLCLKVEAEGSCGMGWDMLDARVSSQLPAVVQYDVGYRWWDGGRDRRRLRYQYRYRYWGIVLIEGGMYADGVSEDVQRGNVHTLMDLICGGMEFRIVGLFVCCRGGWWDVEESDFSWLGFQGARIWEFGKQLEWIRKVQRSMEDADMRYEETE